MSHEVREFIAAGFEVGKWVESWKLRFVSSWRQTSLLGGILIINRLLVAPVMDHSPLEGLDGANSLLLLFRLDDEEIVAIAFRVFDGSFPVREGHAHVGEGISSASPALLYRSNRKIKKTMSEHW